MIDPVKELLQIHIHHDSATRGYITLRRENRAVSITPRTKTVAVFTEGGIELRLQDLQQCLLDQTVGDRRDTQLAFAAIGFGDYHSTYRTGPVSPRQQVLANPSPLSQQMFSSLINVQTVDTRRTFVGFDSLPRTLQVHACSPHSVALMQLRFTSFAVASSRRDSHPQDCAHAGRTQ
ncbi:hypothetical protein D3C76_1118770 [compost metagenome]